MSISDTSFLIVGLGNPGDKYKMNRHNIGFLALDAIAYRWASASWSKEHQAQTLKIQREDKKIYLAKPQTYMNLSGESVQSLLSYYRIPLENLIVLHDDLDMPFGKLKLVFNRGHGGQNGIRNIHEKLGNPKYTRLKCGVGRPPHPEWDIADWVLSNWSKEEEGRIPEWLDQIEKALTLWMNLGYDKAATQVNAGN